MLKQFSLKLNLLLLGGDIALTMLALALARWLRLVLPYGVDVQPQYLDFPPYLYPVVVAIWLAVFLTLPVYDARKTFRAIDQLQLTVTAICWATLIFAGVAYFFFRELSRFLFLYFFLLDLTGLVGMRLILRLTLRWWRGGWPGSKTRLLILGAGRVGTRVAELLGDYGPYGVEVVGFLDDDPRKPAMLADTTPYLGTLDDAPDLVRQAHVDEVILALPLSAHERLVTIVRRLQDLAVNVRVVPDLFDLSFIRTSVEDLEGIPLIGLRDPVLDPFQRLVKRSFDLLVGGAALLLASPVMLLTALLIKLDSPGPVFYTPDRVGERGRLFKMIKFRSMVVDADQRRDEVIAYDENGQIIYKRPDDPRITRVGHFIRRASLDELPQLLNVIKGDMSLVGPRPELPWLVAMYEPWQRKRFAVPQGITGWWQVNGRSNKPLHLNVEEDLYYIRNYSLLLDIIILWKTVAAVVKGSGAF